MFSINKLFHPLPRFTDYADPEDFCDDRSSDEYPSTLIPAPPDQTRKPILTTPDTTGRGAHTVVGHSMVLLSVCAYFVFVIFKS